MEILFTICGRAGSKGISGKNCSNFLGVPLVYYTLAEIDLYRERHPEYGITVALNTDSVFLRDLVERSSIAHVYVPRSDELAGDTASKVEVIAETMTFVENAIDTSFDYVVDLDITSPLRTVGDLERVIDKRMQSKVEVIFTVVHSRRSPYFNLVEDDGFGRLKRVVNSNFTARQQAPATYDMNASIYAYSLDFLNSGQQIFEVSSEGVLMKDTAVLDLDNPEDLELMQVIARYLFETDKEFAEVANRASCIASHLQD